MSEPDQYSIGIIDDNPVIINGLRGYFHSNKQITVLFAVSDSEQLVNQLNTETPDILIMDVILKNSNGVELFRKIEQNYPQVKRIAFSNVSTRFVIASLYATGIYGFIHKSESPEKVFEVISFIVKHNKPFIDNELRQYLRKNKTPVILSKREKEIGRHIVSGKTNKEIASEEFIATNTVDFHRKNLFRKFKVRNAAEFVRRALEHGYFISSLKA